MAGRYVVLRPYVISVNDSQAPRYPTHARRHCWFIYWGGFSMTLMPCRNVSWVLARRAYDLMRNAFRRRPKRRRRAANTSDAR